MKCAAGVGGDGDRIGGAFPWRLGVGVAGAADGWRSDEGLTEISVQTKTTLFLLHHRDIVQSEAAMLCLTKRRNLKVTILRHGHAEFSLENVCEVLDVVE